ncbi:MAG: GNAT family N-acetyltransferase [Armatimonadetes bacterium]|nr:GNAT family N-acetyltransferase [Armatimonadota bacterium]
MEIIVRAATDTDATTIAQFNRAMAQETEHKTLDEGTVNAGVRGLLTRPDYGFYLVAESEGRVIGCLLVTFEWSDWRNGLFWWIQSVYVRPEARRRGVFRALYRAVEAKADENENVCGLRLYVERDNAAAQETYRALGMEETAYRLFETECMGQK